MAPTPLSMGIRSTFSRGGIVDILLVLFGLVTMQCTRTFTKRFTLSTQKEIAPLYGNSQKIRFVGSNSQVYCDKLQNRLSVDFSSRVLFHKEANCHGKTTIMYLFTEQDLPASLRNSNYKRLRSRPKQPNTL